MATFSHSKSPTMTGATVITTLTAGDPGFYTRLVTVELENAGSGQNGDYQAYQLGVPVGGNFTFETHVVAVTSVVMS